MYSSRPVSQPACDLKHSPVGSLSTVHMRSVIQRSVVMMSMLDRFLVLHSVHVKCLSVMSRQEFGQSSPHTPRADWPILLSLVDGLTSVLVVGTGCISDDLLPRRLSTVYCTITQT